MAILAGVFKPEGEDANIPGCFELQKYSGPGLLTATGTPVPDSSGQYKYAGEYRGEPYYVHVDETFEVWWDNYKWVMSTVRGTVLPGMWYRPTAAPIEGVFYPYGTYAGYPVVAVCPVGIIRISMSPSSKGPYWARVPYPVSPPQQGIRLQWALMMRQYALFEDSTIKFVCTENEAAEVAGDPFPDVHGYYTWLSKHDENDHWRNEVHQFDIWRDLGQACWILGDTFPNLPGEFDNWWRRDSLSCRGDFAPQGTALGTAEVSVVTKNGIYIPVMMYMMHEHYYSARYAYHLWFCADHDGYVLAPNFPTVPAGLIWWWKKGDWEPTGDYEPQGMATGDVTVYEQE